MMQDLNQPLSIHSATDFIDPSGSLPVKHGARVDLDDNLLKYMAQHDVLEDKKTPSIQTAAFMGKPASKNKVEPDDLSYLFANSILQSWKQNRADDFRLVVRKLHDYLQTQQFPKFSSTENYKNYLFTQFFDKNTTLPDSLLALCESSQLFSPKELIYFSLRHDKKMPENFVIGQMDKGARLSIEEFESIHANVEKIEKNIMWSEKDEVCDNYIIFMELQRTYDFQLELNRSLPEKKSTPPARSKI